MWLINVVGRVLFNHFQLAEIKTIINLNKKKFVLLTDENALTVLISVGF